MDNCLLLVLLLVRIIHLMCDDIKFHPRTTELTFELPINEKFCFYETLIANERMVFDYRVVVGGRNDVDVALYLPSKQPLYDKKGSTYDQFIFTSVSGVYIICFSNQFNSVSRKLVFFSLHPEIHESLEILGQENESNQPTVESLVESTLEDIHKGLITVEDYQTMFRSREKNGRRVSERLYSGILTCSAVVAVAIVVVGWGQVSLLKRLFMEYRPNRSRYGNGRV